MPVWYYDKKQELKHSPSTQSGLSYEDETRYRREGARFIQELGKSLGLRHDTMATASVYFHRFYMFHSFLEFPRYVTATCSLFLAGKAEETPKKCRDIMKTVKELLNPQQFNTFSQDPREEVMTLERVLLQTIKFDLQVDHPYSSLLKYAKCLKGDNAKLQKMVQMSWTFVNDSLCTTLCLQWEPEVIAIALMYLAAKLSKFEVKDWSNRTDEHLHWWDQYVKHLTTEILEDICHQVLDLYSTPHTNAKDAPPSPPPGTRIYQPKPAPRPPVVAAAPTPPAKPPQPKPQPPPSSAPPSDPAAQQAAALPQYQYPAQPVPVNYHQAYYQPNYPAAAPSALPPAAPTPAPASYAPYVIPPPSGFPPSVAPPARPPINGPLPADFRNSHSAQRPPPDTRGPPPDTRGPPPDSRALNMDHRGPLLDTRGPIPDTRGPPPESRPLPNEMHMYHSANSRVPPHDIRGPPPDLRGPPPDMRTQPPRGPSAERTRDSRGPPPASAGGPPDNKYFRTGGTPHREVPLPQRPPPLGMSPLPRNGPPPRGGGALTPRGGPPPGPIVTGPPPPRGPPGHSPFGRVRGGPPPTRSSPYSRPPRPMGGQWR